MRFVFLVLLLTGIAHAEEMFSAHRPLDRDYREFEQKVNQENDENGFVRVSPLNSSRHYNEENLPRATAWKSVEDMQARFEQLRDERFLTTPTEPEFPRRISWLYPADGCWTRASLFNRNAFRLFVPVPKKVFAFGNLRVKTSNSFSGVVGWWYHVAPIVEVNNVKYVLDPSIESERPLLLNEWLERMGNPKKIKVAICNSGTYQPGDSCDRETDGVEVTAEKHQKHYLSLEKQQLKKLGRNVEAELGDAPPWKK